MDDDRVLLSPVIVTGGCGFTGSHLVKGLLEFEKDRDCSIHVITRTLRDEIPGVTYHECDITNAEKVQAVFDLLRPKTVFHTACPNSPAVQTDTFRDVNVSGTRHLLAAAASVRTVQAFVYTSSASVSYTNTADALNISEADPILASPVQKSHYALTKGEAETLVLAANRCAGDASMMTVSIRPAGIFGERDFICAGRVIANAWRGRAGYQIGLGKNVYDFVYVENLVDAHILVAQALVHAHGKPAPAPESGLRVDGECFNVTNDEPVLFWEFQRSLAAAAGCPVKKEDIRSVPTWLAYGFAFVSEWIVCAVTLGKKQPMITRDVVRNAVMSRTMNGEKAKLVLGYKPRVSMEEAVARTGKWFVDEVKRESEAKKAV